MITAELLKARHSTCFVRAPTRDQRALPCSAPLRLDQLEHTKKTPPPAHVLHHRLTALRRREFPSLTTSSHVELTLMDRNLPNQVHDSYQRQIMCLSPPLFTGPHSTRSPRHRKRPSTLGMTSGLVIQAPGENSITPVRHRHGRWGIRDRIFNREVEPSNIQILIDDTAVAPAPIIRVHLVTEKPVRLLTTNTGPHQSLPCGCHTVRCRTRGPGIALYRDFS